MRRDTAEFEWKKSNNLAVLIVRERVLSEQTGNDVESCDGRLEYWVFEDLAWAAYWKE